jgi:DNA end-binding protein Ku
MSARAIGTSTIAFGLVSLPVKLYSTGDSSGRISFNLLSRETGTKLKQQYIDPENGKVVPREDMAKGYEFAKGQWVVFTDEELKALESPKSDAIEIREFVPLEQVERIYLDKAYYLGPDRGGARAYRLLSAALRESGRAAIATYATRGKQYLVMIRPLEKGLVMEQLKYSDELKSFEEVPLEDGDVNPAELALAQQLIGAASVEEFHPENYRDEVREKMLELIQRKVEGEEITVAASAEPQTQIIDLMAALKASLAATGESVDEGRKPAKGAGKGAQAEGAKKSSSRKKASSG